MGATPSLFSLPPELRMEEVMSGPLKRMNLAGPFCAEVVTQTRSPANHGTETCEKFVHHTGGPCTPAPFLLSRADEPPFAPLEPPRELFRLYRSATPRFPSVPFGYLLLSCRLFHFNVPVLHLHSRQLNLSRGFCLLDAEAFSLGGRGLFFPVSSEGADIFFPPSISLRSGWTSRGSARPRRGV